MPPKIRLPETGQPIKSLDEFDREARKLAGLPEYSMDDPGRPFTPGYDDSLKDSVSDSPQATNPSEVIPDTAEPEDTTPSADNRELYQQPTPARLGEIRRQKAAEHIRNMRLIVKAAQEKDTKDIKTSA